MRLLTFIVVGVIMVGWLRVTWMTEAMAPLALDGAGGVLIGALGMKAWQRGRENLKNGEPTTDTAILRKAQGTPG